MQLVDVTLIVGDRSQTYAVSTPDRAELKARAVEFAELCCEAEDGPCVWDLSSEVTLIIMPGELSAIIIDPYEPPEGEGWKVGAEHQA